MEEIINVFPKQLRALCRLGFQEGVEPEEIRLRIGQPVLIFGKQKEYFWNMAQQLLQESPKDSYWWKEADMKEILSRMSQYSMYAREEELRHGFFTIQGGHRIGITGKTVCNQEQIVTIRNISGLNIRIAREKKGCAKTVLPYLRQAEGIYNTLIISSPGVGKTTLLRDCIRLLSNGEEEDGITYRGMKVGVVDERSEIAAGFFGIPQNDLGIRTDVLDCCPKVEGMKLLIRSMSPEIIAVDELGSKADCEAVEEVLHCGCKILGTMHAGKIGELQEKSYLSSWLEKEFFQRYVSLTLDREGKRQFMVYDEKLQPLC
ncbi:MAG: stage III sporulation protein AA [Lachnospiraceae bacterium]